MVVFNRPRNKLCYIFSIPISTLKCMYIKSKLNIGQKPYGIFFTFYSSSPHVLKHNQFLYRNWWHGVTSLAERSQVTTHIHCILGQLDKHRKVMATMTMTFIPNNDIVINYGWVKFHPLNHWLCPVTWLEQASYKKKSRHSRNSIFSHNQLTFANCVVQSSFQNEYTILRIKILTNLNQGNKNPQIQI